MYKSMIIIVLVISRHTRSSVISRFVACCLYGGK